MLNNTDCSTIRLPKLPEPAFTKSMPAECPAAAGLLLWPSCVTESMSLVDPVQERLVIGEALREPEANLALGALNSIGAVDDVAAHVDSEVAADAAGLCSMYAHCTI